MWDAREKVKTRRLRADAAWDVNDPFRTLPRHNADLQFRDLAIVYYTLNSSPANKQTGVARAGAFAASPRKPKTDLPRSQTTLVPPEPEERYLNFNLLGAVLLASAITD